ncbi:MAG TPA: SDR family oxidoreductase [Solirubrobacteraceae bacterium]|nr:SDR family oxidoreductase [Solirubrobacteraceae bacterium]
MPVAIITGSDSGIGKATATMLAQRGWDVGITWHEDEDGARRTADEAAAAGARTAVCRADLTDVETGARVVGRLADHLGGIDALINNAGTGAMQPLLDMETSTFRSVLDVDLVGAFTAAREAARRMVAAGHGGRIVNVTSVHEHVPLRGAAPYVAAKHGLGGLTKVLALELAEHGIRVNAVAPGEIATPMTGQEDVDPHAQPRPLIPAGRPGDAREIAALVAWLCSDESAYVTGSSFVADGGMLLMAAAANAEARPA